MTSILSGIGAMAVTELSHLVRERRLLSALLGWEVALATLFLTLAASGIGIGVAEPRYGAALSPLPILVPVGLTVTAIAFVSGVVSRDWESGMFGLMMSSPVSHGSLTLAKFIAALAVYWSTSIAILLFYVALAPTVGWIAVKTVAWLLLLPFFSLYLFLVGVCFLCSVAFERARNSIVASTVVLFPTMLLTQEPWGVGPRLLDVSPPLWVLLRYNPYSGVHLAARRIINGAAFPKDAVLSGAMMGFLLLACAHLVLVHKEAHQ